MLKRVDKVIKMKDFVGHLFFFFPLSQYIFKKAKYYDDGNNHHL